MPRIGRQVFPGHPHDVTQRGNRRLRTFFCDDDYRTYLKIAADAFSDAGVEVWAYCLMPNHVHIIAVPSDHDSLSKAVGLTHLRYTRVINKREGWDGFLWQGRFASFAMDERHLIACARYVGLNPVRAGLTKRAIDWPWSSVGALVESLPDALVNTRPLAERLGAELPRFFEEDTADETRRDLRLASLSGKPLGARDWLKALAL